MGRPVREIAPGRIYLISTRVEHTLFLLPPTKAITDIVGSCLARALAKYPIEVFAILVMSNHVHILACDPLGILPLFMAFFNGLVARLVNKHLGREGKFWSRRYAAEAVLDDDMLEKLFAYVLCNPCNANLVDRAADWPGLTTVRASLHGEPLVFQSVDYDAYHKARRRDRSVRPQDFIKHWEIHLTPLPCWEDLTPEQQRARAARVIAKGEQEARAMRLHEHKTVMGVRAVQAVKTTDKPRHSKRSPRPLCHTTDSVLFFAFRDHYYEFQREYRESSRLYRAGYL